MANEKYALLDADFISKMHQIRKDDSNILIDVIVQNLKYNFCCHEQIKMELERHSDPEVSEWLESEIVKEEIRCYDDRTILKELETAYGASAPAIYADMLKMACDAYCADYYKDNFIRIAELDYSEASPEVFLEKLQEDCTTIGKGNNLGELKTYVLLQFLHVMLGKRIYVFCSDDKDARRAVISMGGVRCISVLSMFLRLNNEIGFGERDAEEYVKEYLRICKKRNQTTFKIQDTSKERRLSRVPCEQVFEELYQGRLVELKTGELKYSST